MNGDIFVILDNIRSVHNVASIFRTADGAGVAKVYLCGITPAPVDRFGRARKDFAKVALGAEKSVAWEHYANTLECIRALRTTVTCSVVAVEQDGRAVDYRSYALDGSTAFVFGAEVDGISRKVLDECDAIIEIPMKGAKESLNVSVAAGIILFQYSA